MSNSIDKELNFGANNYAPVSIVLTKASGSFVYDEDGNRYLDFVGAYSAASLGHSNKRIIKAMTKQAKKLAVTSRAFYNDVMPNFLEKLVGISGFEKVLMMNSGAEAVETSLKIARKWGETVKQIPKDEGIIVCCVNNFHGRTLGAVALSTEPQYRFGFGPFMPGVSHVEYGNIEQLKVIFEESSSRICAFILEPIQGEAGIITPPEEYLQQVRDLCSEHNVLLICDEIQTGLARTGKLFCYQHYLAGTKPDILILGKALGGGVYPVSAVLADKHVMDVITPGDHGSTFGGNPIACAIGIEALTQLSDDKLLEEVESKAKFFIKKLEKLKEFDCVKEIRGKGLFVGIEFKEGFDVKKFLKNLRQRGILSKDTHVTTIRLAPSLYISEEDLAFCAKQIKKAIKDCI